MHGMPGPQSGTASEHLQTHDVRSWQYTHKGRELPMSRARYMCVRTCMFCDSGAWQLGALAICCPACKATRSPTENITDKAASVVAASGVCGASGHAPAARGVLEVACPAPALPFARPPACSLRGGVTCVAGGPSKVGGGVLNDSSGWLCLTRIVRCRFGGGCGCCGLGALVSG